MPCLLQILNVDQGEQRAISSLGPLTQLRHEAPAPAACASSHSGRLGLRHNGTMVLPERAIFDCVVPLACCTLFCSGVLLGSASSAVLLCSACSAICNVCASSPDRVHTASALYATCRARAGQGRRIQIDMSTVAWHVLRLTTCMRSAAGLHGPGGGGYLDAPWHVAG